MDRLYTTPAGWARFHERIAHARAAYDAVVATNGDAAEAGDNSVWHDNFAYEENQRQMHALSRRIRDLEAVASRLTVVSPGAHPQKVGFGCAVVIADDGAASAERFVIGGYEDSDATRRRVAYTTPLAQALMGAVPGDTVALRNGERVREVTVIRIEDAMEGEL